MRKFTPIVVGVVLAAAVLVGLDRWVSGSFEGHPSALQQTGFASMLREQAVPGYGVPVILDRVEVVFGRYSPDSWPLELLDWHGYQYAVHYRLGATGAEWVEVFRPDASASDLRNSASALDSDTVSVLSAFHRLARAPMFGTPGGGTDGSEADAPAGSDVWDVATFDASNTANYFYGDLYYLERLKDGKFVLVPQE